MRKLIGWMMVGMGTVSVFGWGNAAVDREARYLLRSVRHTTYSHDIRVSVARGFYELDCSAFASLVLSRSAPLAYSELAYSAKDPKHPLAKDFVGFFENIATKDRKGVWNPVTQVRRLEPGDLIAWLVPAGSTSKDTGHVMFVSGEPRQNPSNDNEWLIPIIDSTTSGHGKKDPRKSSGPNGVGAGVVGLIVDRHDRPLAFRWSGGESAQVKYTRIRMARVR